MNKQYEYEQNLRGSPANFFEKWFIWHGMTLLLPVDRGFLVKTRSEAQSRVSRPYESRFSPYKFSFFLVFSCFNFVFLVKNFRFFSKPTYTMRIQSSFLDSNHTAANSFKAWD